MRVGMDVGGVGKAWQDGGEGRRDGGKRGKLVLGQGGGEGSAESERGCEGARERWGRDDAAVRMVCGWLGLCGGELQWNVGDGEA